MKKLFCEDEKLAYYATEEGQIWSLRKRDGRWLELKLRKLPNKYLRFCCYQNGKVKDIYVHRAVYEAFNGPIPQGLEINHKNCVRDDNRLLNLELVTRLQNNRYLPTRGHQSEAQNKRWLDPAQREKAREAKRWKMKPVQDVTTGVVYESVNEAARQTGLHPGNIYHCCNGRQHQTGGHAFAYVPSEEERLEHEIHDHIETLANELSGGML